MCVCMCVCCVCGWVVCKDIGLRKKKKGRDFKAMPLFFRFETPPLKIKG